MAPLKEPLEKTNGGPPVVLRGLHKAFGQQVVLNGIDITVARGETFAVLGRSGTGKSVLLRIIVGLEKPDSGSVNIHGQEIAGIHPAKLNEMRRKDGLFVPTGGPLRFADGGRECCLPVKHNTNMPDSERRDRARQLLESVGMEGDLKKMPSDISGGMQKRVGLARALALDPDILLLDEPTAGLDPITSGEIDELILKLQKEHAMASIVVTHDLQSAKTIAGRLALLHEGNIVIEGAFSDLEKSDDKFVSDFMRRDD